MLYKSALLAREHNYHTCNLVDVKIIAILLTNHARNVRKSTRKNAPLSPHRICRGWQRRGQLCVPRVSRFCAWIYEFARQLVSRVLQ